MFGAGVSLDCVGCHEERFRSDAGPSIIWRPAFRRRVTSVIDPPRRRGTRPVLTTPHSRSGVRTLSSPARRAMSTTSIKAPREDCVGCHLDEYEQTSAPNHVSSGFPTTCMDCHRNSDPSWGNGQGSGFNHGAVFPLRGQHATVDCASCHIDNVFAGTPRNCVGCHLDEYEQTSAPNHASAGFPTTCVDCHRNSDPSWGNGQDRAGRLQSRRRVPAAGTTRHRSIAPRVSCHIDNVFARHAAQLRRVPPRRVRADIGAEPCVCRVPDHLRGLSSQL